MPVYLQFIETARLNPEAKTKRFLVHTLKDPTVELGVINWYNAWRRYVFLPHQATLFDRDCLFEVLSFLEKLMRDRQDGKS